MISLCRDRLGFHTCVSLFVTVERPRENRVVRWEGETVVDQEMILWMGWTNFMLGEVIMHAIGQVLL